MDYSEEHDALVDEAKALRKRVTELKAALRECLPYVEDVMHDFVEESYSESAKAEALLKRSRALLGNA